MDVVHAVDMNAPAVYDLQDAFYVPFAGFAGIARPGPNLSIWERTDVASARR